MVMEAGAEVVMVRSFGEYARMLPVPCYAVSTKESLVAVDAGFL